MKKIITAIALTLAAFGSSAATFGDWESAPQHNLISTYTPEGSATAQVAIHNNGNVGISLYPESWEMIPNSRSIRTANGVMAVNGQRVNFIIETHNDGSVHMRPATAKGRLFVVGEFWKKAAVTFTLDSGAKYVISAKGVKAAWAHLMSKEAI